jgi:hypothetical protein
MNFIVYNALRNMQGKKTLKFTVSLYPVFLTSLNISEFQIFWFKMQQSFADYNDYVPKGTNAVDKIVFVITKT